MEQQRRKRKRKKRKKKRSPVVGVIYIVIGVLLIFIACSIGKVGDDDSAADASTVASTVEDSAPAAPAKTPTMTQEEFADFTRKTLAENGLSCTVEIDRGFLVVKAYNDDITTDLALAAAGDEKAIEGWYYLRDSMVSASTSVRNAAVSNGLDDLHVSFMLMNPLNKDVTILTIADDSVFNDSIEEIINGNKE